MTAAVRGAATTQPSARPPSAPHAQIDLAIVGSGPTSTYVMERLAATSARLRPDVFLNVHVFDLSGQFGAGQVHSPHQPTTSYLNRIVGQVAFAADESVEDAGPLLDARLRPTLVEWCQRRYEQTGDDLFALAAEDWPKRYVHGLALQECFQSYATLLADRPNINVHLHRAEVVDVQEIGDGHFQVLTHAAMADTRADHVLFLTGHSSNDPRRSASLRPLVEFASRSTATYVPVAYPLERHMGEDVVAPGAKVGCAGMGLTAIDIILFLTEARGGRFERDGEGQLHYRRSGREPAVILPFSEAGLFTFARPYNAKEQDLAVFEHRGRFLTEAACDQLRATHGRAMHVPPSGTRNQIDFELHLLPLVVLEMAYVYYRTMFGPDFGERLAGVVRPALDRHLCAEGAGDDATVNVLAPVEELVQDVAAELDDILAGRAPVPQAGAARTALTRYLETVLGRDLAQSVLAAAAASGRMVDYTLRDPAHGHALWVRENLFSWSSTIRPIADEHCSDPDTYSRAVLQFMRRDHLWATQGSLDNPAKAAADGVWRDLRQVLAHAVDFGGLTAESHRTFLQTYMRHHNRLANGAALEVMEKILSLIESGLVNISAGPGPQVLADEQHSLFRVTGRRTGAVEEVEVLVDGKVHPFDPENDVLTLYPNLLRSGLVRKWHNPSRHGRDFEPGGLALSASFHPVRADGTTDTRLTFLGPPSEGVMFFQLGALRPNQNHHVMQDILSWLRQFWQSVDVAGGVRHSERHQPSSKSEEDRRHAR